MKNTVLKVKFEAIGGKPNRAAAERLKQAAKLEKIEEAQKLKTAAASLRPQRDFIGKEPE